jgi:cystathionine beta-synthase
VTHFVAGIGTGGTITGVGRFLKSQNPAVQIVGADPEGSVYSGGSGRPYLVEGIGEDFWPSTYDAGVVDRVVTVSDRDSFLTARMVTREEGILVGGSTGTAIRAALDVGRALGPEAVVVVLIPDSGRGYLSKLYNDAWMADFGFLLTSGQTASGVLAAKRRDLPPLVHVHPDESVRQVIAVLREYDVSQMPVLKAEPPLAAAEVVGSVADRDLLEGAFRDPSILDRPVGAVMGPSLPTVGAGEPIELAVRRTEDRGAVVVLDAGHPVGILTRSDLLGFLVGRPARGTPRA